MRGATLARSPISVSSVGRPSAAAQNLVDTRKSTLARSPMSVRNVGRPLFVAHTLVNTKESIQDRGVNEER